MNDRIQGLESQLATAVTELEKEIAERKRVETEAQRRAHELVALAEVGREVLSTLDLSTVMERIAGRAKDLLQAMDVAVYLVQPDGCTLQVAAAISKFADEIKARTLELGMGFIGQVAQTGVGEIINKPSQDSRGYRFASSWNEEFGLDDDLYPTLIAPITVQETVIGVIAIWRYVETGLFTPADLHFLEALSQQAAIAIQNARLFEAEQHQHQLAESLREVAFVLSSSLDQSTVVAKILEQLGRVIPHDGAALFLQEGQDLVLVAGISVKPSFIGIHIPISHQNPGARVFRDKELMMMEDVRNDPGWETWSEAYPIRTWMGAPLMVGERAIGVLTADNFKIGAYTVEDGQNLQTFANHAAIAIENARLFEAKEKANRELAIRAHEILIFNDAIQMMNGVTDLISALEVIAQIIVNFLEARNCGIALLNETKTELQVVASVSPYADYPSTVGTKIPVIGNPSSKHVIETRRSLVIPQVQQHSLTTSIHALMRQLNTECLMIVPLLARGEVIGTIGVDTDQLDREFTPAEVRFVETMAGQIAGAVGMARLFKAEQHQRQLAEQRSQELEAANASLQAINAELDAFARTVAHDLKNPLGALTTYADLLVNYGQQTPPDKLQFIFHEIQKSSQKATNIVEELLLLASMRKGTIRLRSLNMAEIVAEACRRLHFWIEEYQAEIIYPQSWPQALGYEPWVEEVWVNYLSNGLKYGGQPPCLELGATLQPDGMIRFWVHDNGPGLPPEEQARLFAEFTRLDEVRAQGHGLGLSIVRRIVEKLGGQVGVQSEGVPGQGSVFYFTLAAG